MRITLGFWVFHFDSDHFCLFDLIYSTDLIYFSVFNGGVESFYMFGEVLRSFIRLCILMLW